MWSWYISSHLTLQESRKVYFPKCQTTFLTKRYHDMVFTIDLHSKLMSNNIHCCPALCGSESKLSCAGYLFRQTLAAIFQLEGPFLKMYVIMTASGALDESIQQMPDWAIWCFVTSLLCLCCRLVREYADGSLCVACHAECRPLNGSASCHGPVRRSCS